VLLLPAAAGFHRCACMTVNSSPGRVDSRAAWWDFDQRRRWGAVTVGERRSSSSIGHCVEQAAGDPARQAWTAFRLAESVASAMRSRRAHRARFNQPAVHPRGSVLGMSSRLVADRLSRARRRAGRVFVGNPLHRA
jgi:hypothetical protein